LKSHAILLPMIIIGWRIACRFNDPLKLYAMLLPIIVID